MNKTLSTFKILKRLLSAPKKTHYGFQIIRETGLPGGTVYPCLVRLENEGWLTVRLENIDPVKEKRPARKLYRLTPYGLAQAQNYVDEVLPDG